MASNIPERLRWALEHIAPKADEQILEIGCGPGVLAALICEKLADGRLLAIDRSAHAIALARKRNREHEAAGKVQFRVAAFEKSDLGRRTFDKIVAVHVNLFWTQPGKGADRLRRMLAAGGALYLIYQSPSATSPERIVRVIEEGLRAGGFSGVEYRSQRLSSGRAMCIVARNT